MSLQLTPSSISEAYASDEDELDRPRLSSRLSLILLTGPSLLGYGLTYQAASLAWSALAGG